MPEPLKKKMTDSEVLPDYNLLRKTLSRLVDNFDTLNQTVVETTKTISKISKIDADRIQSQETVTDTRVPAVAPEDYPVIEKNTSLGSPVIKTVQSQTTTQPVSTNAKQGVENEQTKNTHSNEGKPAKPPTFISKITEKLKDTFENVTTQQTVSKDSFMYKTMERVGDSVITIKEKLKEQPKINKILETSSTAIATIKERLKDHPGLTKVMEKTTGTLSNIKDNLKEQPKKIAQSAIKFGKEGWQEQKEMNTPLMKIIAGVKDLGKGNITGAAKQIMSAKDTYTDIRSETAKQGKQNEDKSSDQLNNINTAEARSVKSGSTKDTTNIQNINNLTTSLEQNTKKLDEWSSQIASILSDKTRGESKITDINKTQTISDINEATDKQTPDSPDLTQSKDEEGLRRLEKPKPVIVTNVDEIARAIKDLTDTDTSSTKSKTHGISGIVPQTESGDSGGGLMSILGTALGFGKNALSKAGGLISKGARGALGLGKKVFTSGKSLLGKGVNMVKNIGGSAGKLVTGGVSKAKSFVGGVAKKTGGLFSKAWGGLKSLGGKVATGVKSVGGAALKLGSKALSKAGTVGKAAISGVKSVASKLNPGKLFSKALSKIPAGKLLGKIVKLPLIGTVISGILAASDVKDILNDSTLTEKDKRKQVGKVVGKSISGILGGAVAAGLTQLLNIFPGLGAAAAPLAYLGGDFIGSTIAGYVMNNIPGIDDKIGEITGKVFKLDFKKGSKSETKTPASAKKAEQESKKISTTSKSEQTSKTIDTGIKSVQSSTSNEEAVQHKKASNIQNSKTSSQTSTSGNLPIIPDVSTTSLTSPEAKTSEKDPGLYKQPGEDIQPDQVNTITKQDYSDYPVDNEPGNVSANETLDTDQSLIRDTVNTPVTTRKIPLPTNNTTITPEEVLETNQQISQGIPLGNIQQQKLEPVGTIERIKQNNQETSPENSTLPSRDIKQVETLPTDGIHKTSISRLDGEVPKQIGLAVAQAMNTIDTDQQKTPGTDSNESNQHKSTTTTPEKNKTLSPQVNPSLPTPVRKNTGIQRIKNAISRPESLKKSGNSLITKGVNTIKSTGSKIKDKLYKTIEPKVSNKISKLKNLPNVLKTKLTSKRPHMVGGSTLSNKENKVRNIETNTINNVQGDKKEAPTSVLSEVESGTTNQLTSNRLKGTSPSKRNITPKESTGIMSKVSKFIKTPAKAVSTLISNARNYLKQPGSDVSQKTVPKESTGIMSKVSKFIKTPAKAVSTLISNSKKSLKADDNDVSQEDTPKPTTTPIARGSVKLLNRITDKAKSVGTKAKNLLSGAAPVGKTLLSKSKNVASMLTGTGRATISSIGNVKGKLNKTKGRSFLSNVKDKAKSTSIKAKGILTSDVPNTKSLLNMAKKTGMKGVSNIQSRLKSLPRKLRSSKDKIAQPETTIDTNNITKRENKGTGILSKLKKSTLELGSGVVRGATAAKEKARSMSPDIKQAWKDGTKPNNEKPKDDKPNIVSNSTSSSSNNTTVINRYDTDTISRWRSKYIDDQHKPGHYSLFS